MTVKYIIIAKGKRDIEIYLIMYNNNVRRLWGGVRCSLKIVYKLSIIREEGDSF
jgi:hypothetical protein